MFPAWPDDWDAQFTLRARGSFVVSAIRRDKRLERIDLRSEAGATCRLRNPWGATGVIVERNGRRWRALSGPVLMFDTAPGDQFTITAVPGANR